MSCLVSIIIPVYNTEQYLAHCIESVLSQSYIDFELLLIDDGSTDESGAICDSFLESDNRIRVFHKENGGVSSARNVGLDNSNGEWVFFLDSDDLLPNEALEVLVSRVNYGVDMVYGGIRKFDEVKDNIETINVNHEGEITIENALDAFVAPRDRSGDWHRYMINRLYRLPIINEFGLRFHSDIYYKEDGLFVVQYLCCCKNSVVCIPEIVYLYRQTTGSAMGSLATRYNDRLLTNVDSHGLIYRELRKWGASKDVLRRELNEIFGNYDWITRVMKRSDVYRPDKKRLLLNRVIKNAGPVKSFYHFVIRRFARTIKRKLS